MPEEKTGNGNGKHASWVAFLLGLAGTIAAGFVGYGQLQERVEALVDRIERVEHVADSRETKTEAKLADLERQVRSIDKQLIRICSALPRCRDNE